MKDYKARVPDTKAAMKIYNACHLFQDTPNSPNRTTLVAALKGIKW